MLADTLVESPLSPPSTLGPFRRQDYERLPEQPRYELIYGRLYLTPSPTWLHQIVALLLWHRLDRIACRTRGLALAAPLDVTLADHSVVQPDVIYLTRERRPIAGEHIEGAPDLLVEVLSPGSVRRDRGEKLRLYAESGVQEYWLVDPAARQIEFLVNRDGRFQIAIAEDDRYASEALPDVELDLDELWREVEERLVG